MKTFFICLGLSLALINSALSSETHESDMDFCISKHIKSAIKVNKVRKKKYAALTNGKTRKLSNQLITGEKLSLISAKFFDKWALKYQRNEIPIMCKDLIKMDSIPEFRGFSSLPPLKFSEIYHPNLKSIVSKLKKYNRNYDRHNMHLLLQEELTKLANHPEYYCTLRHFLESIHRTVVLSAEYHDLAIARKLKSPKKGLKRYLTSQIITLKLLAALDRKAATFQEDGLPIFCQDLPPIPIPEYHP